jgi:hypothetical protein
LCKEPYGSGATEKKRAVKQRKIRERNRKRKQHTNKNIGKAASGLSLVLLRHYVVKVILCDITPSGNLDTRPPKREYSARPFFNEKEGFRICALTVHCSVHRGRPAQTC